jgi:uncharacterized membrane protein YphA (DoxX/SURF4 family)
MALLRDTRAWAQWTSLVARLLLAGVFLVAAVPKLGDTEQTVRAVRAYRLLPESSVRLVAYALPYLELALALLLLVGLGTRVVAAVAGLLLIVFLGGLISAWARGLRIDCGCFGGGGVTDDPKYVIEVLRDVGLLLVAGLVLLLPRSALSLDNALEVGPHDRDEDRSPALATR